MGHPHAHCAVPFASPIGALCHPENENTVDDLDKSPEVQDTSESP